ncbi:protein NRT1/ PTR FAMILY 2.7-like isoform X1 [Asparagus officinalis]|uniref:protein NRT1/ PTR FAMILY 2.7-like isoform X1 n=2 Tax=Asparagus officinalis TaxID=4686 RepID=UPI00098E5F71|nr:protein NRT1/ PTR FAMILY 2.7-like isoform X1 [Asparagus officinalis]
MAIDEALMTYADPVVGGRKTFPFIVAAVVGVGIGAYATLANSGIYLMEKYNVSPVDGSVIASVFVGSTNLAPVVGGVISDTCLSCFAVISVACAACFLGMLLFTLTAIFPSLRPPSCTYSPCQGPTTWQFAILFMALALMTVGLGGTRFTGAAMGAAQFGDENDRDTFFSWYLVAMYISSIIGIVGIVYIQANLGWVLGFGVCAVIAAVGFVIFLLGNRYYRHPKPQENPLVDIFRQILSRAGKRKAASESSERLLCCSKVDDGAVEPQTTIECPRSQEEATTREVKQEDELTILLRLVPLITTGIILSFYLGLQMSASFLQALVMDLHLTPRLTIPIGSISIFLILSATLSIPLLNYLLYPLHRFLTGQHPTPLARIGFGFLITTFAMVYGALTERKRLHDLQTDAQPISVLWLVPCFMLVGFGEALHFPGQLAFFYQEFPESFKGSGMAVSALQSGVGSYATSAGIGMIRRFLDGWMADNANESRLDKVYWLMAGVGAVNFGCFVACARLYMRKKGGKS